MFAFIGDLHLGVKVPNEDFINSLELFINTIKNQSEECRGIFVVGDLFDHRLSINEATFAANFITKLCRNECGKDGKNVPVYFIHGTYSHDLNQYEIFLPLLNSMDDVSVFYTKTAMELIVDDINILCIPHENGDIDYSQYADKHYDLIVGHGVIASNTKNPCKTKEGIVHSAEQLGNISKLCVFGHYHGYTDFGNNVFYTGPWLRWRYGEDEDRVFFFCDDNMNVFTVPNPYAKEFKTIIIHNPEELRDHVNSEIDTPHRFIIESNPDDMTTYRSIIMSTGNNANLKFQLTEIEDEDVKLTIDEALEISNNESSQPIPSLITYIKDKYGVDATDKIAEYETQINKEKKGDL
jgi:hypothetical protein